jgi:diguanylate cyclase (GGDEF)-like protein
MVAQAADSGGEGGGTMTADQQAATGPTGDELADLSERAGDVHAVVDPVGTCVWSSGSLPRPGIALTDSFRPDDAAALTALLALEPQGPLVVRLVDESGGRWVAALAIPRPGGGWLLQLRDAHRLDPSSAAVEETAKAVADREQVLEEVAWLLSATPRTGKEIAVASCDLDDFGRLNDTRGTEIGDEVLQIVTRRISEALRSGDVVARLDSDQLLVVLRGVHHLRGAIRVANKIRAAVEDPIELPSGDLVQTVSIGVTLISRGESVESVLERAEGAMAMAKDAGRNTVMSSPPI